MKVIDDGIKKANSKAISNA